MRRQHLYKLFSIVVVFMFMFSSSSFAQSVNNIQYFGTEACISCIKAKSFLEENVPEEKITYHDILNEESSLLLVQYKEAYGVDYKENIPIVFIGDTYLSGEKAIKDNVVYLESLNREIIDVKNSVSNINNNENINIFALLGAGLIDGINPCSIAMLLFFVSFVSMGDNHKKAIKLGVFYTLGIFVSYYIIGIGLINFLYSILNIKTAMISLYLILFSMSLFLVIINIKDYLNIKKGREDKIKNQLSDKNKKKIHSLIRKYSNSKFLYIGTFFMAFFISFLEFFCTGQMYLPAITYLADLSLGSKIYIYLFLYNLAFIAPLVVVLFSLKKGLDVIDISSMVLDHLGKIKIMGAVFFCFVIFYSIKQVISIL